MATVIIFGLIITGVMITYIQVLPYIEHAQSEEAIAITSNSFLELDTTIKSLLSESGSPGGFRTVLITKPAGKIDYISDSSHFSLRLFDQDDKLVYNIIENQGIGVLDWAYNSPQSILPRGTTRYLTGPDPYKIRDPVFLTGIFGSTDYQDLTNLTLSHLDDRLHHITLNYRISIYVTISTQPEPELRFELFLILLSGDFSTIHSQYEQINIHSQSIVSEPHILPKNASIGELKLVWDNSGFIWGQVPQIDTNLIWSTKTIQGFDTQYFNIVVQVFKYEIGLSTS
ncbi:MAG: hypothetical protein JSV04_13310 [Candidatus Heimdallarchaeota archaeon]|nr:MAG: hypothetical protein JSV04_13310 [Candidatus Heimdallarchaeota archaeon]